MTMHFGHVLNMCELIPITSCNIQRSSCFVAPSSKNQLLPLADTFVNTFVVQVLDFILLLWIELMLNCVIEEPQNSSCDTAVELLVPLSSAVPYLLAGTFQVKCIGPGQWRRMLFSMQMHSQVLLLFSFTMQEPGVEKAPKKGIEHLNAET